MGKATSAPHSGGSGVRAASLKVLDTFGHEVLQRIGPRALVVHFQLSPEDDVEETGGFAAGKSSHLALI